MQLLRREDESPSTSPLKWAAMSALMSSFIVVMWLAFVIDKIPLGAKFLPTIAISIFDAAVTASGIVLVLMLIHKRAERQEPEGNSPLTRTGRIFLFFFLLGAAAATGATLLGIMAWADMQHTRILADANLARKEFVVLNQNSDLDQAKVNQTLAEFERARRHLQGAWEVSDKRTPATLVLFSNIFEYQDAVDREWSAGGVHCSERGPVIYIPLERTINFLTENDRTHTPMHEMVHALMCQTLETRAYLAVPSWFHEGMAQLYENDPWAMNSERTQIRIFAWMSQDTLPDTEAFCEVPSRTSRQEVRMFYLASYEFARSLEAQEGRTALIGIMNDIKSREPI